MIWILYVLVGLIGLMLTYMFVNGVRQETKELTRKYREKNIPSMTRNSPFLDEDPSFKQERLEKWKQFAYEEERE